MPFGWPALWHVDALAVQYTAVHERARPGQGLV